MVGMAGVRGRTPSWDTPDHAIRPQPSAAGEGIVVPWRFFPKPACLGPLGEGPRRWISTGLPHPPDQGSLRAGLCLPFRLVALRAGLFSSSH